MAPQPLATAHLARRPELHERRSQPELGTAVRARNEAPGCGPSGNPCGFGVGQRGGGTVAARVVWSAWVTHSI